jgi:hypothetical protein
MNPTTAMKNNLVIIPTIPDVEKLIGGYATGSLIAQEQSVLFERALKNQHLFNALMEEQALKDLLDTPGVRQTLVEALESPRRIWFRRPLLWAMAGSFAVLLAAIILIQPSVQEYRSGLSTSRAMRESTNNALPESHPSAVLNSAAPKQKSRLEPNPALASAPPKQESRYARPLANASASRPPVLDIAKAAKERALAPHASIPSKSKSGSNVMPPPGGPLPRPLPVMPAAPGAVMPHMPPPVMAESGPTIVHAVVQPQGKFIQLPAGETYYIYSMVTGGAAQSSAFTNGQFAQVTDAAGQVAAALAHGTSNSNSFSTGANYYTIGGVAIGGNYDLFTAIKSANSKPGACLVSSNFTVTEQSLVVLFASASGQKQIQLGGLSGLQVDASSAGTSGVVPMAIAHVQLSPGSYIVTATSSVADLQGQDPSHMAVLLGVFIFGKK